MPDHPIALELLRACGGALAVTSANLSGQPDHCDAESVESAMGNRDDLVLDGGRSPGGQPSTVVDGTGVHPRIIRVGPIDLRRIEDALRADPLFTLKGGRRGAMSTREDKRRR